MESFHFSVIPAKAGIHWLQLLRDPCLRRDDGEEAFFDPLRGENEFNVPGDCRVACGSSQCSQGG